MSRVIKFRCWVEESKYEDFDECENCAEKKIIQAHMNYCPLSMPVDLNESISRIKNLMQFTGLHDKLGREIYESDLVNWDGDIYEVKFINGEWALYHSGDPEHDRPSLYMVIQPSRSNIEIISNIYEKEPNHAIS